MTDRGLPLVDGAPACPFVAFEDDRDARATAPDHRHRCYAEVRPAPRALAHQEAYCLSSAFPVCPTFQDWARREAAQARAAAAEADDARAADQAAPPPPPDGWPADPATGTPGAPGASQRNPPRSWAAPPPWLSSRDDAPEDDGPDVEIQPPVRGGGLAGSFADRIAGGQGGRPQGGWPQPGPTDRPSAPADRPSEPPDRWQGEAGDDDEARAEGHARQAGAARPRPVGRDDRAPATPALPGPSWERPRRLEAYPTLKTRIGLPSLSLPPMLVGVAALVLAAVALFFLPTILGLFGDEVGTGGNPSPSAPASGGPSASPAEPTPIPAPTQQTYIVQKGDTLSGIALKFGIPYAMLREANLETVPDEDVLLEGQEIIIPVAAPTTLPGVSPTLSPTPAT